MPCHKINGHVHGLVEDCTDEDIRILHQNMKNIPTPNLIDTHGEVTESLAKFFRSNREGFNVYQPQRVDLQAIATMSVRYETLFKPFNPKMSLTKVKDAIKRLKHMVRSPLDRDGGRLCVT